jgi:acetyl esterase/lipase
MNTVIRTMRGMTNKMFAGNNEVISEFPVERAKAMLRGRKSSMPVPLNVKITKVKIPIINDFPGIHPDSQKGTFNGEWVDYPGASNDASRVILYLHGSAYALMSRRTHRHVLLDFKQRSHGVLPSMQMLVSWLSTTAWLLNTYTLPHSLMLSPHTLF